MKSILVLTENPSDYPGKYVLREHFLQDGKYVAAAGEPAAVGPNLEAIHKLMAAECRLFVDRDENDDPVIVGTYI